MKRPIVEDVNNMISKETNKNRKTRILQKCNMPLEMSLGSMQDFRGGIKTPYLPYWNMLSACISINWGMYQVTIGVIKSSSIN